MRNFIIFTVGCPRVEEILGKYDALFKKHFKGYEHTFIFYLEGRFSLANGRPDLSVSMPGTDLLRHPALLSPEFEISQYEKMSYPLERCTIYDVGSRSFECLVHLEDVIAYWRELAGTGMTLREAYLQRWPESDYQSPETLRKAREPIWKNLEKDFYEKLYQARADRWTAERLREAERPDSLRKFCEKRIAALEKGRE